MDRESYFAAFGSSAPEKIAAERVRLEKMTSTSEVRAYLGALLMKEAQYQPSAKQKLAQFTKGKKLLETAIAQHASVAEYRFLRLAIQEHCPKLLHYNGNLKADAAVIAQAYAKQSSTVRRAIRDYSRSSAVLPTSKLSA